MVATAKTAVLLPRWVHSIFMMAPRLSLHRQIFRAVAKVQAAMEATEAITLFNGKIHIMFITYGPWAAAEAAPVVASAALPATSAQVALAAEAAEAVPLVLFKAVGKTHLVRAHTTM